MIRNRNTQVAKHYDKKAPQYGIHPNRLRNTLALLKDIRNETVLDIGCATGYLGHAIQKNNNYVVGIDISAKAIKKAAMILDKAYAIDIENSLIPTKRKFDLIVLSEIIEHFFQPDETLSKIISSLKPKGKILISTPNFLYWGNRLQFLRGTFVYTNQGTFDEGHIHFFTYSSLKQLLSRHGFRVISENHLAAGFASKLLVHFYPGLAAYHLIILAQKN